MVPVFRMRKLRLQEVYGHSPEVTQLRGRASWSPFQGAYPSVVTLDGQRQLQPWNALDYWHLLSSFFCQDFLWAKVTAGKHLQYAQSCDEMPRLHTLNFQLSPALIIAPLNLFL